MVFTADDLLRWKDFPKGLRVLLLDEDSISVAQTKSKLEEMHYIVSTFSNESDALTELANKPENFHVAIVEVSVGKSYGSFRFLETAKDLPTVTDVWIISAAVTSNIHCLSTMMKCIALGAAEFLQKPLSEDKLRNIWQHVVHKAFNAGENAVSKPLKPIRETVSSMIQLQLETTKVEQKNILEAENEIQVHKKGHEQSVATDRFPAPSTPQLKQGERLLDDGECHDQSNFLLEKEIEDQGDPKFVETTCNNTVVEITVKAEPSPRCEEGGIMEEDDSTDGSKTGNRISSPPQDKGSAEDSRIDAGNSKKASLIPNSCRTNINKKKMKVDWTPELHKRFVQAIEHLGVDQAIPSQILELMKVEGLTRHNVASHLQKYRMHRRHIIPREDDRRWQLPRDTTPRVYPQKPVMAFPPYHFGHGFSPSQHYPAWGHPSSHPSSVQVWGHPSYPTWQSPESCPWKTYPGMHADAWGCPVMPMPQGPYSTFPQSFEDKGNLLGNYIDLHPAEEVIDKVVKEAISKPWLPLPLGLKPPSTESVLSELHRQGISCIPPYKNTNSSC
ncbi:PREDICTED: two-component response regulator-like APRR2 isoform X2 [Nelumbo nucifera]|uniref:Two-component response regulator-like APRR2 isoform X2 n=1 Tax=Nelumbo nucifera TaxID=4432 RepID=A0A1U8AQ49_NELNU|nr:PREDICTED: two-component response regulator-like APRR2 isoform X2 [Nelumbo nucifera]